MKNVIATIRTLLSAIDFESNPKKEFFDEYYHRFWEKEDIEFEGIPVASGFFRISWILETAVIKTVPVGTVAEKQCESEVILYQQATEWGCERHFAKPLGKIFEYRGISCWAYEKVVGERVFRNLPRTCSAEDFPKLFEFLDEIRLRDLHGGNYRMVDGSPVILDYGGTASMSEWMDWLTNIGLY